MSKMKHWFLAILFVIGIASTVSAVEFTSGIKGRVWLHNSYVSVRLDPTNAVLLASGTTTPFSASFRVYSTRTGRLVATVSTHLPGRFRVSVPPGNYRVVPETYQNGRVLSPGMLVIGHYQTAPSFRVRVRPGQFTPVTVTYEEMMGF
jgi:hypothetical protein